MKVLHSIFQQIWKTQQWPQDWKRSVFIPIPKKGNAKECSTYHTVALISHARKVMLKILQARLQQYMNHELPDVQAGFFFFYFRIILIESKISLSLSSSNYFLKDINFYFIFLYIIFLILLFFPNSSNIHLANLEHSIQRRL